MGSKKDRTGAELLPCSSVMVVNLAARYDRPSSRRMDATPARKFMYLIEAVGVASLDPVVRVKTKGRGT